MLRGFFQAPDFLMLLRFWDESRDGRNRADWDGDLARLPAALLPNLVITDVSGPPTYRYFGQECVRRVGHDPTGRPIDEILHGAHGRYILSLLRDIVHRGAPIFSSCIYQLGAETIVVGRLCAPFTYRASRDLRIVMGLHLFAGDEFKIEEVGSYGFVDETKRFLIPGADDLCEQLGKARRFHTLAPLTRDRELADEWHRIAHHLASDIEPLTPFVDRAS